jgi:hypothetical protein
MESCIADKRSDPRGKTDAKRGSADGAFSDPDDGAKN